jgi:CRISPR-associated protein Csb2
LLVTAKDGFDEHAREVLADLKEVYGEAGHPLQLVLLGIGDAEDFAGLEARRGHCPSLARARVWESRTPYLPTRHQGRADRCNEHGEVIDSLEDQVRRELRLLGLPDDPKIERLPQAALYWAKFRSVRKQGGGARAATSGSGLRLTFKEPIVGLLALGYGAHFGLGRFEAVSDHG